MANVIIIEDNADTRRIMGAILQRAGYSVRTAAEGGEALRLMDEAPADVLLTDIFMPGMDGFQTIAEVHKRHPRTYVIAFTGFPDRGNPLHSAAFLGARQLLLKPLNPTQLLDAVAHAVNGKAPPKSG
jgi:DNA-binding NtrC family response regulator